MNTKISDLPIERCDFCETNAHCMRFCFRTLYRTTSWSYEPHDAQVRNVHWMEISRAPSTVNVCPKCATDDRFIRSSIDRAGYKEIFHVISSQRTGNWLICFVAMLAIPGGVLLVGYPTQLSVVISIAAFILWGIIALFIWGYLESKVGSPFRERLEKEVQDWREKDPMTGCVTPERNPDLLCLETESGKEILTMNVWKKRKSLEDYENHIKWHAEAENKTFSEDIFKPRTSSTSWREDRDERFNDDTQQFECLVYRKALYKAFQNLEPSIDCGELNGKGRLCVDIDRV